MGGAASSVEHTTTTTNTDLDNEDQEWKTLRRTTLIPSVLYPEGKTTKIHKISYDLPCTVEEFWPTAFTDPTDSLLSRIEKGSMASPVIETLRRRDPTIGTVDGVEQTFARRHFSIQPIPSELTAGYIGKTKEVDGTVKIYVYQEKGDQGYMEFAFSFEHQWASFIKVAGYATAIDTPDEASPATLYVVFGIQADFHSGAQVGCIGNYWLTKMEEGIHQHLYERVRSRFEPTVRLFEKRFND